MNKRNIILIGMPGAGKSSVGVILAKVLGYEFIDTDLVIQHREKRLLREIIADEGNEGFLAIENEVNATLEANKSVIAPGGSAIYGKEAMEHFKEIGTIVYLKLSYEDLAKRLGNLKGRGVVLKEGQTLKDLYDERSKLYEQYAEITVDESGRDIKGTILALREQIRELERVVLLKVIDRKWMDHIDDMEQLKQGINLRAYGQKDPVIEYQVEGYNMFEEMIHNIGDETVRHIMNVVPKENMERKQVAKPVTASHGSDGTVAKQPVKVGKKVGRNDPCPCGSGKKYKKCCGFNQNETDA